MPNPKVPTNVLLSLTTLPMLLGLLGAKALADLMQSVGQASEELFRGDRLPVINQPISVEDESQRSVSDQP